MKFFEQIKSEASGAPQTFKQSQYLYRLTGLKFWQPEIAPPPTMLQAGSLISEIVKYIEKKEVDKDSLLKVIQIWFPNVDSLSIIHFRNYTNKAKQTNEPSNKQTESEPKERTETQPEKQPEPKTKAKEPEIKSNYINELLSLINAGLNNIWLKGPAGCGKTTICEQVGQLLELPVTVISCGAGTSPTTFTGLKYPVKESNEFIEAYSQPGIIVLDEFTALEKDVAQILNSALANGRINTSVGTRLRNDNLIIIATSNTFGDASDRIYSANNVLDGSNIDRFAGAFINMDYDTDYEKSNFDLEVCEYVWKLRNIIKTNGLKRIASTRGIINATKRKIAGLKWKESLTINWSENEKALL